jgi:hypothetical protein
MLESLKGILSKAKGYIEEREGKETNLLNDRIIFDQFPLLRQIQISSDGAKGLAARLAGIENPKFEDTETTIDELLARIDKTLAFLATVTPEMIDGREDELVAMPYMEGKAMAGFDYATLYGLPNFYFHVVVAYEIIRKSGAPIGKGDFLTALPIVEMAA